MAKYAVRLARIVTTVQVLTEPLIVEADNPNYALEKAHRAHALGGLVYRATTAEDFVDPSADLPLDSELLKTLDIAPVPSA